MVNLYEHQRKALERMKNGCILCGGTGTGKSRTALAYYMYKDFHQKLYIITTAKKRDDLEWEHECIPFKIEKDFEVIVDSWNNIGKYVDVTDAFFIFDEQRVVGTGSWSKSFLKIVKRNRWILLSATPGDKWVDYTTVFIANGFFKNKTDFNNQHVIFNRYTSYPSIQSYYNTKVLEKYRNSILIPMKMKRDTTQHHIDIWCDYDKEYYKKVLTTRFNYEKDEPLSDASKYCYYLRKIVNDNNFRDKEVIDIVKKHKRVIIFYNFDYEWNRLTMIDYPDNTVVSSFNGHVHETVPNLGSEYWVYLVQYSAGCEGWNCISCNTMIFYSQSYSYRQTIQASGRIDRLNTRFTDLYYYHLKSKSSIDLSIAKALKQKKDFNARNFLFTAPNEN